MGCNATLNVRKVTIAASDDANMLSFVDKVYGGFVDSDGRDSFLVAYLKSLVGCRKSDQFCLFWGKGNVVGGTIVKGETQDVVEEEDVIGDKDNVVGLAN